MLLDHLRILVIFFSFPLIALVSPETLYGGTIYWRPTGNKNEISFTYRLAWNVGNWGRCNPQQKLSDCWKIYLNPGSPPVTSAVHKRLQSYSWRCTNGCNKTTTMSSLRNLQFTDIATFLDTSWETGVGIFTVTFADEDMTDISFGFVDPTSTVVDGLGEGRLSLAIRNDTKRPNLGPAVNVFPVYRVPLGCDYRFRLFPFDGDGDYVHCHWQRPPGNSTRGITLYEDLCEVEITATTANGYSSNMSFALSLYAEDYSRDPVKLTNSHTVITTGPLSRVPIKLTVHIADPLSNPNLCNSGPTFLYYGTLPSYYKESYRLPFQDARLPFKIPGSNMTILTTGPKGLIYYYESVNSTTKELGKFSVSDSLFKGVHLACGHAYTADGIPGESRCAVLLVEDPDECKPTNPCTARPGGKCNNLFEYYTCEYPDQFTVSNASYNSQLCQTVYVKEKGDDDLGLKVGVPVGLSLLWLLILAFTVGYLKRYWLQKLKSTAVEPAPDAKTKLGDMMPA